MREFYEQFGALRLGDHVQWRARLTVLFAAALCGLVVALFAMITERAYATFVQLRLLAWWSPFLVTPLGGIAICWLTRRFFPGAEGSGIPQVMAALSDDLSGHLTDKLVSLRIAFGKVLLGSASLVAGFSSGREGPSVQVGAAVMQSVHRFLPAGTRISRSTLMLAGGAAGIAAAFNTPLAGIVFAIEELAKRFEHEGNRLLVSAIVLSGLVSISLLGNYTYFGRISIGEVGFNVVYPVLVCGILTGISGGLFSRMLILAGRDWHSPLASFRRVHPLLFAGLCGLFVAALGYISDGGAHGTGYAYARATLEGGALPWHYGLDKYAATVVTYLAGLPGGIFAPALSIGVGLGSDIAPLLHGVTPPVVMALCMAGFLAAVTQAPLTSFIIVMEMIDGHAMVISLMAIAVLSSLTSHIFSGSLYANLTQFFVEKTLRQQVSGE